MTDDFETKRNVVSTMKETDKKCPSCGGVMDFDPTSAGLKCPFCGHSQELPQVGSSSEAAAAEEQDFESAEQTGNHDWGKATKTVVCQSCAAESIYDTLSVASTCPYCGSNQVMEVHGEDTLAPGGVCPFKIDKKSAGSRFTKWLDGKLFCPSKAKQQAKPEAFQGVYLPYWTFDANTSSRYTGRYGYRRERTGKDGKKESYIEWHDTSGWHEEFINDELVMGTDRYNAGILMQIEPFDTENNVAYKPEYLAGFTAERYSIGLKDAWEKAKDFIRKKLTGNVREKIRKNNHADKAEVNSLSTTYANITYKYLMLPVWISAFKYNGKTYQFMVNGQSGKVGGKSPISALRVTIAVIIALIAIGVIAYLAQ